MVMEFIEQLSSNFYLQGLIILGLFFFLSKFAVYIFEKIFLAVASKTSTEVDDLIVKNTKKPISLILLIIGIRLGLVPLPIVESLKNIIYNVVDSIIILIATVIVARVVGILIENWGVAWAKKTKSSMDDALIGLFHKATNITIYILGFIYILNSWGFEIGPVLASLGIAGIAIAFALQSSLANVFGGISLILDENMKVGQVVKVDDVTTGEIVDIGFRSTKIKSWDNEIIIVPNGVLANSVFKNISQPTKHIRVVAPFGVEYGSDIEKVKKLVYREIKKVDGYLSKPEPSVKFLEMADSALNFKAFFYIDNYSNRYAALDEINERIYNALNKNKIGIPFPQMDVHMKKK